MTARALVAILISALCTLSMRALPFLLLGKKRRLPAWLERLGRALPSAIMAVLVIYCLKNVSLIAAPHGIPELLAIAAVVGLHLWKKNTLLSIFGGTAIYMILVQAIFA